MEPYYSSAFDGPQHDDPNRDTGAAHQHSDEHADGYAHAATDPDAIGTRLTDLPERVRRRDRR